MTLIELRFFSRGVSFDIESYLDQLKTVDNIICMCSLVDAFEQQYKKKFTCDELFIRYYVVVITNKFQYIVSVVVII